jgi:hypothetical protein
MIGLDPCDGWQRSSERNPWLIWPAERADPVCLEGFTPQTATPVLAKFLRGIRTDWHRWANELDWTLESGPDEAPSCVDICVPYSFSGGGHDYFAGGCWNPGDPVEVETGTAYFIDDDGVRCEVNLTEAETARVELHIAENPPEPDFEEDYR